MRTGRRRGAEEWISTLNVEFRIRITNTKGGTQSQFLGATTAPGTHLGLSELAMIRYTDVMTSYYDATSSHGD